MRALVLHPASNYNIGDLLTYRGTQEILRIVDPDVEFLMFDMWRAERELDTYMSQFYWGDVDLLVLAGSPWIWLNLERSAKYRILCDAIKRFDTAKKIALGVGSCFPLNFLKFEKLYQEIATQSDSLGVLTKTLGSFDFVLTRDALAQAILSRVGVESQLSVDTSWWTHGTFARQVSSDKPLCIYIDPAYCLSRNVTAPDFVETIIKVQQDFVTKNDAEVYAISAEDAYFAMKRGFDARYVADLDWMAAHMYGRPVVMSGRVHMGVLASIMGSQKVFVLPLDSRILTLDLINRVSVLYSTVGSNIADDLRKYKSEAQISGKEVTDRLRFVLGK